MNLLKKILKYLTVACFWLTVWVLLSLAVNNEIIFPSPTVVIKRLFELLPQEQFINAVFMSILRVVIGVFFAIVLAIVFSVLAVKISFIKTLLSPFNEIVKATPIVSFIFLAYIVFNKNIDWLPVFIVVLIVFPVVYGALFEAWSNMDKQLVEVADVFGASPIERIRYLWIPTALSAFASSASTSIGLGWKAGIAAEALAASPALIGLGTEIYTAKLFIETVDQFALTFVIILLSSLIGIIFSSMMSILKKKLLG